MRNPGARPCEGGAERSGFADFTGSAPRQAVDQVRREQARALNKTHPAFLKRTHYLGLKNPENLTDKQRARPGYSDKLNLRCNGAHFLIESFRGSWSHKRREGLAQPFLQKRSWRVTRSRRKPMRDFVWTLRPHEQDIPSYFELRIDKGPVQTMNNKAKVVSHPCYGFPAAHNYITAPYYCLGDIPEPEVVHKSL